MDSVDLGLSLSLEGAHWRHTVFTGGWCPALHTLVYSGALAKNLSPCESRVLHEC